MIKANGKLQQPTQAGLLIDQTLQEWRSGSPPGREPKPAELLAKSKGGPERVVEEGSYKGQLWPRDDQLQK